MPTKGLAYAGFLKPKSFDCVSFMDGFCFCKKIGAPTKEIIEQAARECCQFYGLPFSDYKKVLMIFYQARG